MTRLFAHPIDKPPVSTPDTPNETAYATRAKLIMPTPAPDTGWSSAGMASSIKILFADLKRQFSELVIDSNVSRHIGENDVTIPIVISKRTDGRETWIALSSPVAPDVPASAALRALTGGEAERIVCVDELLVRRNSPAAIQIIRDSLR
jgi:hypothetical protein